MTNPYQRPYPNRDDAPQAHESIEPNEGDADAWLEPEGDGDRSVAKHDGDYPQAEPSPAQPYLPSSDSFPQATAQAPGGLQASGLKCVQCGYNLTGATIGSGCPECATPVETSIAATRNDQSSGKAITSMVLGICALPGCMFYGLPSIILGPLAIIFGVIVLREVKDGTANATAKQQALAGIICGGIATGLAVVGIVAIVLAITFG